MTGVGRHVCGSLLLYKLERIIRFLLAFKLDEPAPSSFAKDVKAIGRFRPWRRRKCRFLKTNFIEADNLAFREARVLS